MAETVEEGLVALLRGFDLPGLSTRIYPVVRPQGSPLPAITYTRVSRVESVQLAKRTGLAQSRFDLRIYADTYTQAYELSNLLKEHLHGHKSLSTGTNFRLIKIDAERDIFEDAREVDAGSASFVRILDISLWHAEA